MKCVQCYGTGSEPVGPRPTEPCSACNGTGKATPDEFERKLREAVAKIGMVYVIRDDASGRIKIGTALNPLARLRDLQTGSSTPLRLLAMFAGGRKEEQEFQKVWPERRLTGEWFDDRDETISEIILHTARSDGIAWPQL